MSEKPPVPDAVMRRVEQAMRQMGAEHMIPWARFRLGHPQQPPSPSGETDTND